MFANLVHPVHPVHPVQKKNSIIPVRRTRQPRCKESEQHLGTRKISPEPCCRTAWRGSLRWFARTANTAASIFTLAFGAWPLVALISTGDPVVAHLVCDNSRECVRMIDLGKRNFSRTAFCIALLTFGLVAISPSVGVCAEQPTPVELLERARQLRAAGNAEQSEALLIQIDDSLNDRESSIDLAIDLAAAGKMAANNGRTSAAINLFGRSIVATRRPAASKLSPKTISLIQLTAANGLHKCGNSEQAAVVLVKLLTKADQLDENRQKAVVDLGVSIGWKILKQGKASRVENLLEGITAFDPDNSMASLGYAWSLAAQGEKQERAIEQLKEFVRRFPEHPNVANATTMQFQCATALGDQQSAFSCAEEILSNWPDSAHSTDVASKVAQVVLNSNAEFSLEPSMELTIWKWLDRNHEARKQPCLDAIGLWIAATTTDEEIRADLNTWDRYVENLSKNDSTGQTVSDLLVRLNEHERLDDAERIASSLISKTADPTPGTALKACEAACRWAGRTDRWTLLALAAESGTLDVPVDQRSVAVEKLFAEALIQTGRGKASYSWWQHLTDTRGVNDFASLLRCAETASNFGTTEDAAKRIDAAASVSNLNGFQKALLDFLRSDLAIRRLEFDGARSRLERIIRSTDSSRSLRGRAQWMIGETYFLQHKFADAIEAYRKVEGIDPGGSWVAPALVQAGKSFEQLGRTREAAICYGDLISRFPQSQHATVGRDRLARIAPTGNASKQSIQR